jgi:hypothetical protein
MTRRYEGPDGLVHLESGREKYATPAYRETVCETIDNATFFAGRDLLPTNAVPTCVRCLGREEHGPLW